MSVVLSTEDGRSLSMNAWNWGVLHHLVSGARLLPEETWEVARYIGTDLDEQQVKIVAEHLERVVLRRLDPGERMFFDGSKTTEPDDGTFFREPDEQWRNYSLHRDVLVGAIEFLKAAGGRVSIC